MTAGETSAERAREEGAPPSAERRETNERLSALDGRLNDLDQRRSDEGRIAGPISMLSAGYATGVAALAGSLVSFVGAERVADEDGYRKRLDINDDDELDGDDEATFRRLARASGVISAVGFGVGIAGTVMLAKRLQQRRAHDPEVRELQRERQDLKKRLDYGANVSGRGLSFSVSGRF